MSGAFPDDSIVLHIGPHKTGTTAIQNALWHSAERLRALGVAYPGRMAHEMDPAMAAALGRVDAGKNLELHRRYWDQMVSELRGPGTRIGVLSSEFYATAADDRIDWLLTRLGPSVQVVITLRPLARIIPSQWQQYVQNGLRLSYVDWLHDALDDPDGPQVRPSFWARHRHDRLVHRWVRAAGAERVTVVVVDDRDPGSLPSAFERLLGVPGGTIVARADGRNRSLTYDEAEALRAFNLQRGQEALDAADYDRFVRFGGARGLQDRPSDPGDQHVLTPAWAVERATDLGASFAAEIRASGVRVIGALEILHEPALAPAVGENPPSAGVDVSAAAGLVTGVVNRLAGVPGSPEVRPGAGAVEREVWRRHRLVNALRRPGWQEQLTAERDDLQRALRDHVAADTATRIEVLRELLRRAPGVLRRSAGRAREAGRRAAGK